MVRNNINNDVRKKIVDAYNNGKSAIIIADILGLKRTTVSTIISNYIKTGTFERKFKTKNTARKLLSEQIEKIQEWIDMDATISLRDIAAKCQSEFSVFVSKSTIHKRINEFSYSLKRLSLIPERRNNLDNIEERYAYAMKYYDLQGQYPESKFIFIDEVGFNVSLRLSRGRSRIGTPAIATVSALRTRNISVCCAMSNRGIVLFSSSAGAYNSEKYRNFLIFLMEKLNVSNNEKYVFIMGNVKFHKTIEVKEIFEQYECELLYLPPYSPFLNPIENMFSKWKEYIKRRGPSNETDLMNLIETGSHLITQSDCEGYLRNMFRYISRCVRRETITD